MPFYNSIRSIGPLGAGRRVKLGGFKCLTHTNIVTFNPADNKCYYPASYAATATTTQQQQGPGCYSGGGAWGSSPGAGCCSCSACPFQNCIGCFDVSCLCYSPSWVPLGNGGGGCYQPYFINVNVTTYSCPVNTSIATVSGSTCVYPATYNATFS